MADSYSYGMADSYPAYEERPRRRWGRRLLITAIVLLLVLGGLLLVADRVAAGYAEQAIAEQAQKEVAKQQIRSSEPEVSIGGFPFLTQVVAGRYESISILVRDAEGPVQGKGVRLSELEIDARNVTASIDTIRSGQGEVTAESLVGTGTVAYDTVAQFINKPGLTLAEQDGELLISAPLEVLHRQVTVHGTAALKAEKGQIALKVDDLTAEGLPNAAPARALLNAYARQISIRVPLPALPYHLKVQKVQATADGVAVTATAANVPLSSVA